MPITSIFRKQVSGISVRTVPNGASTIVIVEVTL